MFFVILKIVRPNTHTGCSDTNSNLENMKMFHLKHETSKANLQISEWMNEISNAGETYSKIVRQKFNLYSTSYYHSSRTTWVTVGMCERRTRISQRIPQLVVPTRILRMLIS